MLRSQSRYVVALLALALLPAGARSAEDQGAGTGQKAPTAAELKMPASAFADVSEVITRTLAVDDGSAKEGAVPPEITVLRRTGLASTAQYRYRVGGERPGQLKVRVDVFRDEATAIAQFRGRHLPQALAMTQPFAVGDDGFIYQDQYAGFRVGPVAVEIRAEGASGRLPEFARSYADFVLARVRPAASPPPGKGGA
ncbi:MAG TPA: hypothetical protein VHC97_19225 [Thermoanaerobaculia bacterium]|jgi:hypothetical protein|nr:hypothetical protein [Thermoanaerobaculia bacterium]